MVKADHEKLADGVQYAVVPLVVGAVALVTVTPPAVYPVPDVFVTSSVVEYAVVAAPKLPVAKYKAALKVLPVLGVKLCVPVSNSPLKLVHIAVVFAILFP
jgi:hypothetical protein